MTDNDIDEVIEEVTNEIPVNANVNTLAQSIEEWIANLPDNHWLLQTIDDLHDDEEYEGVA